MTPSTWERPYKSIENESRTRKLPKCFCCINEIVPGIPGMPGTPCMPGTLWTVKMAVAKKPVIPKNVCKSIFELNSRWLLAWKTLWNELSTRHAGCIGVPGMPGTPCMPGTLWTVKKAVAKKPVIPKNVCKSNFEFQVIAGINSFVKWIVYPACRVYWCTRHAG